MESIDLGARLEAFVSELAAGGRYKDRASVLRQSVLPLEERERKLRTLAKSIKRGLADIEAGRTLSVEEVGDRLRARLGARVRMLGNERSLLEGVRRPKQARSLHEHP